MSKAAIIKLVKARPANKMTQDELSTYVKGLQRSLDEQGIDKAEFDECIEILRSAYPGLHVLLS